MPPSGAGANVFIATVSLSSQSLFPRSQAVRRSTERNVSETHKIHPNSNSVDEGCLENAVQRTLGLNKSVWRKEFLGVCCAVWTGPVKRWRWHYVPVSVLSHKEVNHRVEKMSDQLGMVN